MKNTQPTKKGSSLKVTTSIKAGGLGGPLNHNRALRA
jgi:hypothetical protein